jgi:hypothetical protein
VIRHQFYPVRRAWYSMFRALGATDCHVARETHYIARTAISQAL